MARAESERGEVDFMAENHYFYRMQGTTDRQSKRRKEHVHVIYSFWRTADF